MNMHDDQLLQIKDLHVSLQGKSILRNINLTIFRGSIHAIIGPNGAGKSTLVKAILGGMPHIGYIGLNFNKAGNVGYVPQGLEIEQHLPITVYEFLALGLQYRPIFWWRKPTVSQKILDILENLGISHLQNQLLQTLSGGELRRTLIAHALILEPEILILDEPFNHIDVEGSELLQELIIKLRDDASMTILIIEHDQLIVEKIANRVTKLDRTIIYDQHLLKATHANAPIEEVSSWNG